MGRGTWNAEQLAPLEARTCARAALDGATGGPVPEGGVGGGAGMIACEFKGGTGTASRRVALDGEDFTVAALVQANHGLRDWLTVCGVSVGRDMQEGRLLGSEQGSIIVIIATDAPVGPLTLRHLARRAAIGIGRGGTPGGNNSGDIFLAFPVAAPCDLPQLAPKRRTTTQFTGEEIDPLYLGAVEAVEEAVLNTPRCARRGGWISAARSFRKRNGLPVLGLV